MTSFCPAITCYLNQATTFDFPVSEFPQFNFPQEGKTNICVSHSARGCYARYENPTTIQINHV